MNEHTALFRVIKLEEELARMNEKIENQNVLLKDLIQLLAPSFSNVDNNDIIINNELIEASTQARENGIANPLNPDLLGKRDIPKALEEVKKKFKSTPTNSYPGPILRLLGLVNHFKKEKNITDLQLDDKSNRHDYKILKTVARRIHDDMVDEIYRELKNKNKTIALPFWSEVSSDVISRYVYKLERTAAQHGFPLSRCQDSWAARLLLFESHKHRSNRSRNQAVVSDGSSFSGTQVKAEALRGEKPSSDCVNLNRGGDFYETYDYDQEFTSLSLFPLPPSTSPISHSPSPPLLRYPSPPPLSHRTPKKRVISRDDESSQEEEDLFKPSSSKPKKRTTHQSKRQKNKKITSSK